MQCIILDIAFKMFNVDPDNPTVTKKSYFTCLGSVISNAKDWEGQRAARKNKK